MCAEGGCGGVLLSHNVARCRKIWYRFGTDVIFCAYICIGYFKIQNYGS